VLTGDTVAFGVGRRGHVVDVDGWLMVMVAGDRSAFAYILVPDCVVCMASAEMTYKPVSLGDRWPSDPRLILKSKEKRSSMTCI
jgi:hypothetical protein